VFKNKKRTKSSTDLFFFKIIVHIFVNRSASDICPANLRIAPD
jgi:hypothetical protein